ncbi:MAG: hypothetical protein ACR65O_10760 [Methylomicrobium sp.]
MPDDHIIGIISLAVGLISLSASVVFFIAGLRSERRNQELLNNINSAIQSWQSEIMASNIELLNSRVEIVGKNVALEDAKAKHDFLANIAERVKYIVEHPATGDDAPAQAHQLKDLLQCFENATKSSVPPELLAQMIFPPKGTP